MTVLLVAATGGHLVELRRLAPRIPGVNHESVWVTFDTPQSRAVLKGCCTRFVPYTGSRDISRTVRNVRAATGIIRDTKPSLVVSTGNAIAVSFLPLARLAGIPAAYIESAARADGPSVTGRILRAVPGVQLFAQHETWASPPWTYAGSIFDAYVSIPSQESLPIRRVVVTLGTSKFGFRRLIERVLAILPPKCHVVWQVGATNVAGLGIRSSFHIPALDLEREMMRADVIIAHAGIGSALASLDAGKCPILVPRERNSGEHVDDHQSQIARSLDGRNLAVYRRVVDLTSQALDSAARRTVVHHTTFPHFDMAV